MRDWACYGLSNIGPGLKDALPALEDLLLNDKAMNVRRIATNAIGSMGAAAKPAVPSLRKTLKDGRPVDAPLRRRVAGRHRRVRPRTPSPTSSMRLTTRVRRTKSAVEAVGDIGPAAKKAVPALLDLWKDPGEYDTRNEAAQSIKKIDPETAKKDACP